MKGIIHGEADETTTSEERKNVAEKSTTAGSEIHISKLWNNKKTHNCKKMKIYNYLINMAFSF